VKRWWLLLCAIIACGRAGPPPPFQLRLAVSGSLEAVKPLANVDNWTFVANSLVFEPLVLIAEDNSLVPVLAARSERASPTAIRLWLRDDATFSDGSRVTVDDLRRSFAGTDLSASADGDSFLISTSDPKKPPELQLAFTFVHRKTPNGEIGTGPYVVVEQDATHIVLHRRKPNQGRIGDITVTSYGTPKEAFARTLKGDADMLTEVDPRWIEFLEGVPRLRVVSLGVSPYAAVVAFNSRRLSHAERLRIAGALRNDSVRKVAYDEGCVAPDQSSSHVPPLSGPGRPLNVLAFPALERLALAARRALGQRGGDIVVRDFDSYIATMKANDYDLAVSRPQISPAIMAARNWRTGAKYNIYGYSNARVDAALDAHDWDAAQRALDDDPPAVVICRPTAVVVVDSRIANISKTRFWRNVVNWQVRK
jgi:ABC-type transport system substrate-binding protein